MPGIWPFNNVATADRYSDATTAQFPVGRRAFSLQVYNAAVMYKLIAWRPPSGFYIIETEHYLAPVVGNFKDPRDEGLAAGELFGGILLRSNVSGSPARVTVI